jgi:hypothetical protein
MREKSLSTASFLSLCSSLLFAICYAIVTCRRHEDPPLSTNRPGMTRDLASVLYANISRHATREFLLVPQANQVRYHPREAVIPAYCRRTSICWRRLSRRCLALSLTGTWSLTSPMPRGSRSSVKICIASSWIFCCSGADSTCGADSVF